VADPSLLQRALNVALGVIPTVRIPQRAIEAARKSTALFKPAYPTPFRPDLVRLDNTLKGPGWIGTVKNPQGQDMTEVSAGMPGTDEGFYPLMGPWLTESELQSLRRGERPSREVYAKARAAAMERERLGQSPFAPQDYSPGPLLPEGGPPRKRPSAAQRVVQGLTGTEIQSELQYDPKREQFNALMAKSRGPAFTPVAGRPLSFTEEMTRKAVSHNIGSKIKGNDLNWVEPLPSDKILIQRGTPPKDPDPGLMERILSDPRRPVEDWTGNKLKPRGNTGRGGEWL
jgi:hypothetical protein